MRRSDFTVLEPGVNPTRFEIAGHVVVNADAFFDRYRALFGLSSSDRMTTIRSRSSGAFRHIRMQQFHDGVPVDGAQYVLTELNGRVLYGLGHIKSHLRTTSIPALTAAAALKRAQRALRLQEHGYRSAASSGDKSPTLLLRVPGGRNQPRLLYRSVHQGERPEQAFIVEIDAHTGEVILIRLNGAHAQIEVPVLGSTLYDGVRPLAVLLEPDTGVYSLQSRQQRVTTFDSNDSDNVSDAVVPTTDTTFSGNEAVGAGAHWAAVETQRFLKDRYGIAGVLSNDEPVKVYVRSPTATKATTEAVIFGTECPGNPPSGPCKHTASVDTVAHELGHTLLGNQAVAGSDGEPGALNESYSDVLGAVIEWHLKGSGTEWTIGEDWGAWGAARNLQNPLSLQHPISASHCYRPLPEPLPTSANDFGQTHVLSVVASHAFYLLSEGNGQPTQSAKNCIGGPCSSCTPFTYMVVGIGRLAALDITHRAYLDKLSTSSGFNDARNGQITTASELFGEFSQERISTENAWHAVDVGNVFSQSVFSLPADGATNISPWPVKLQWQVGKGEDNWDIQLSKDPQLQKDVLIAQTSYKHPHATEPFAIGEFAQFHLAPDTTYYWRVRRVHEDVYRGWRPVRSFRTSSQVPSIHSPKNSQPMHPWSLPLKWQPVEGATGYEMEISPNPSFNHRVAQFSTDDPPIEDRLASASVDTLVNQPKIFWRIRARGPQEHVSAWSSAQFRTTMPYVDQSSYVPDVDPGLAPDPIPKVHLWPVHLSWKGVAGARRYQMEISADDIPFSNPVAALTTPESDPNLQYHLAPTVDVTYRFRARPVGPNLKLTSPDEDLVETGIFYGHGSFQVDISQHVPDVLMPPASGLTPWPCVYTYESDIVTVASVKGAVAYNIEMQALTVDSVGDPFQVHATSYTNCQVETDVAPGDPYTCSIPQATTNIVDNQVGYRWAVRAVGPDGSTTGGAARGNYLVQPDKPEALVTPDGPKDSYFSMRWAYTHAHFGWEWQLFSNGNCQSQPLRQNIFDETIRAPGSVHKVDTFLSETGIYSWRVRPFAADACVHKYQWSDCAAFEVVENDNETPSGGAVCNEEVQAGGNFGSTIPIELGKATGTAMLSLNTFTVPDELVLWYEGAKLFSTGCYGTGGATASDNIWTCVSGVCSRKFSYSGNSSIVDVEVKPDCQGIADTKWMFKVSCPP